MSNPYQSISLRAGILRLYVERAELPLEALCGFASRRSRKRGFVFVSKVLGKHYPVRPRVMADVQRRLASKLLDLPGPVLMVAMAETATGLGHGVFEWVLRLTGREDVLFLHTTRYWLRQSPVLRFEEPHSHAIDQLLYEPEDAENVKLFRSAVTLVLIDDEISTGRTLANLAAAYRRLNPHVRSVQLVCITDWRSADQCPELAAEIGLPTSCHSLLQGSFTFTPNPNFEPGPIPRVDSRHEVKEPYLLGSWGRRGLRRRLTWDWPARWPARVRAGEKILVLGSGEFAYPPYCLAQYLEEQGGDVYFQTTTRSPLLVDGDLGSVLEFGDNYHDDIPNYLYNVAGQQYNRILIGYETSSLPATHRLPELLAAEVIFFESA
ncbi:MAG: phosphoribosyltransferase domain-containing protein [Gemmataceae bacterium]